MEGDRDLVCLMHQVRWLCCTAMLRFEPLNQSVASTHHEPAGREPECPNSCVLRSKLLALPRHEFT